MGDMDQGIKRLLQLRPQDILTIAFPDAHAEYLGPLATDVAMEPQLITDVLQRARLYGEECAVDFEAEAYPSAEMPRRCFLYGARIDIIHNLPVLSVVLLLQPGGTVMQPPYQRSIGPIPIATWHFQNIEVYRLQGRDILNAGMVSLMPLVPFMADRSLALVEEAARAIQAQVPDKQLVEDLESMLAVFGAKFFGQDAMRSLMGRLTMSFDIMNESPLFREWMADAEEKGIARGEARGEAKGLSTGLAKGELSGLQRSMRLILASRFGTLDPDLLAAIDAADTTTLEAAIAQSATDSLDQIRASLQQPSTNTSQQPE